MNSAEMYNRQCPVTGLGLKRIKLFTEAYRHSTPTTSRSVFIWNTLKKCVSTRAVYGLVDVSQEWWLRIGEHLERTGITF